MNEFDAELYVRTRAEDALLSPHDDGFEQLLFRARALVAAGLLEPDVGEAIIRLYGRAAHLRGRHVHGFFHHDEDDDGPVQPFPPRRVVRCDATVNLRKGTLTVHTVTLAPDRLRLAVTLTFPHGLGFGRGAPDLKVSDEFGTVVEPDFSGGGGDHEWSGDYTACPGLDVNTRTLKIAGTQIQLQDDAVPAAVRIEPLAERDPAAWHLRQAALNATTGDDGAFEAIVDALVAAGALGADDPVIAEARDCVGSGRHAPFGRRHYAGRSRERRDPARARLAVCSAVTPLFDGLAAAVSTATTDDGEFALDVELAGAAMPMTHSADLRRSEVTISATDDRGGSYRGFWRNYGGGGRSVEGRIQLQPALDPRATTLDVRLAARTECAIISMPIGATS